MASHDPRFRSLARVGGLATQANIYEWAWANPADPTQGVVQSSVVCPGGSGVSAVANVNLSGLNLTQAYLMGANLSSANLSGSDFTAAYLTGTNLSNAECFIATLSGANLSGANLSGAT